jgi:hypothetical protein
MSADIISINRKQAMDFLKEAQPDKFVLITAGDPIQIISLGDMSKAELMGTLEIAKLMIADEV